VSTRIQLRKPHRVTRDNPAETCMNCLARVARSRMREHACSTECLVGEWRRHMREIGYEIAGNYVNIAQHAQGFVSGSTDGYVVAPVRYDRGYGPKGEGACAVPGKWVPARALEAAVECLKVHGSYGKERRLAQILYTREGALESWRAAKRLGGRDALRGLALALLAEDEVRDGLGAT
jgi:hypothetical protein